MSTGEGQEPPGKDDGGDEPGGTTGSLPEETPGKEPAESTLQFYLDRLEDGNEGIRWKAAESLGRLGDPAAIGPLIDTLWDEDARVRIKAAWALGQIGDPVAIRPLQQLYRIENENVREIIEKAIEEIKRRMSAGE
ncbi:MAG TPA: HEAT repeat domain-containing protein [Methanoregula sp.]|nr:HEAT repeat domain-containing protein [Methanoregula sp.]